MEVDLQGPSERESTVGKRRRNRHDLTRNFQTKMTVTIISRCATYTGTGMVG
jgi:hypothetical protein